MTTSINYDQFRTLKKWVGHFLKCAYQVKNKFCFHVHLYQIELFKFCINLVQIMIIYNQITLGVNCIIATTAN